MFGVRVVQTLEIEIHLEINFTCKGPSERSKDRYILFSTINSMHTYIAKDKPRRKKRKGKDAEKN